MLIQTEKPSGDEADAIWWSRIRTTLHDRKNHWNGDKAWARAARLVKGQHWKNQSKEDPASDDARTKITVNLTASTVTDYVPFLVSQDAEFNVLPTTSASIESAYNQTALLNHFWEQTGATEQMRKAVLDAVIVGHGWVKTGYQIQLSDQAKTPGVTLTYDEAIKGEQPTLHRISPQHMLFDLNAVDHSIKTARWVAEKFYLSINDIVENTRYKESIRERISSGDLTPSLQVDWDNYSRSQGITVPFNARSESLAIMWEIWDKRFQRRKVYLEGVSEPLVDVDWPYEYLDGFPYVFIPFIDLPDEPYPLGLPLFLEDQQLELNRIRSKDFDRHRKLKTIIVVDSNAVSANEAEKIATNDPLTVIKHTGGPGDQPVSSINFGTESYESTRLQGVIYDDIRRSSGSDALLSGGDLKSRTSATEVNTRSRFLGVKLDDKVRKVDNAFREAAKQMLQHIKRQLKTSVIVRVVGRVRGEYTANEFKRLSVSDIQGEVDVMVKSLASPDVDKASERQQRLQVWQIAVQNFQILAQSGVQINLSELFKWLMESFNFKDSARFIADTEIREPLPPAPGGIGNEVGLESGLIDPLSASVARSAAPPAVSGSGALNGAQSLGLSV